MYSLRSMNKNLLIGSFKRFHPISFRGLSQMTKPTNEDENNVVKKETNASGKYNVGDAVLTPEQTKERKDNLRLLYQSEFVPLKWIRMLTNRSDPQESALFNRLVQRKALPDSVYGSYIFAEFRSPLVKKFQFDLEKFHSYLLGFIKESFLANRAIDYYMAKEIYRSSEPRNVLSPIVYYYTKDPVVVPFQILDLPSNCKIEPQFAINNQLVRSLQSYYEKYSKIPKEQQREVDEVVRQYNVLSKAYDRVHFQRLMNHYDYYPKKLHVSQVTQVEVLRATIKDDWIRLVPDSKRGNLRRIQREPFNPEHILQHPYSNLWVRMDVEVEVLEHYYVIDLAAEPSTNKKQKKQRISSSILTIQGCVSHPKDFDWMISHEDVLNSKTIE